MMNRPVVVSEGPCLFRELGRLGWPDLDPLLLAEAIALFSADHAPVMNRRLVVTWASVFEWLREGRYPLPPTKITRLTPPRARPVRTPDEAAPVVAEVIRSGRRTHDAWPERDKAMVGVIIAGSLSLANVSMLRVRDIHRDGDVLQSQTRQGRTRDIDLASKVERALDQYLASRRERLPAGAAADLFVRALSGRPYTADTLRYLYVGWFKRAGLLE